MKAEDKRKLALLIAQANSLGIKTIKIEFSGSGDSGGIEDVSIELCDGEQSPEMDKFMQEKRAELEHCGYAMMEGTDVDFNNDGSSGSQKINCDTGKVSMDYEVFFMKSNSEHTEYNVGTMLND